MEPKATMPPAPPPPPLTPVRLMLSLLGNLCAILNVVFIFPWLGQFLPLKSLVLPVAVFEACSHISFASRIVYHKASPPQYQKHLVYDRMVWYLLNLLDATAHALLAVYGPNLILRVLHTVEHMWHIMKEVDTLHLGRISPVRYWKLAVVGEVVGYFATSMMLLSSEGILNPRVLFSLVTTVAIYLGARARFLVY